MTADRERRLARRPRGGTPRPPRDIEAAMEAAGAAGDDVALGIAQARYRAWLADNGHPLTPRGNPAPHDQELDQ